MIYGHQIKEAWRIYNIRYMKHKARILFSVCQEVLILFINDEIKQWLKGLTDCLKYYFKRGIVSLLLKL